MPLWGEILNELSELTDEAGPSRFDVVRRRYLISLYQHTQRNTILYASKWTQHDPGAVPK